LCHSYYTCGPGDEILCVSGIEEDIANAIQIRWQSLDLSIFETNPTVPGQTGIPISTMSIPTFGITNSALSHKGDSGLSTGARAGIGVAVAIILLGFAAGVFLFLRKQKNKKSPSTQADRADPEFHSRAPYPTGSSMGPTATGTLELPVLAGAGPLGMTELHLFKESGHTARREPLKREALVRRTFPETSDTVSSPLQLTSP
jgi:hypothetical protein